MFIFQARFFASAPAAEITAWARSSDIGVPYGVSKGILSGTKSRGFVSVGCSARLALTALPNLSFDIRPSFNGRSRSLDRQWIELPVAASLHLARGLCSQG